jgi:hypothetical protein
MKPPSYVPADRPREGGAPLPRYHAGLPLRDSCYPRPIVPCWYDASCTRL